MSKIIAQLREEIVSNNVNFLKDKSFFEFGVYEGASLLTFYNLYKKYMSIENTLFYGFDSFQGLQIRKY